MEEWKKNALLKNREINKEGSYNCYIFYINHEFHEELDKSECNIYQALKTVEKLANENKGKKITLCTDYNFGGGWYPFNQRRELCYVEVDE